MGITLAELARHLNAKLEGQGKENGDACVITGIAALDTAKPGQVSFLSNARYRKALATTQASAVILSPADRAFSPVPVLILDNPYLGYAQAAQLFSTSIQHHPGIHPTASIGRGADIHPSASVGAYCVIGDDVQIAQAEGKLDEADKIRVTLKKINPQLLEEITSEKLEAQSVDQYKF